MRPYGYVDKLKQEWGFKQRTKGASRLKQSDKNSKFHIVLYQKFTFDFKVFVKSLCFWRFDLIIRPLNMLDLHYANNYGKVKVWLYLQIQCSYCCCLTPTTWYPLQHWPISDCCWKCESVYQNWKNRDLISPDTDLWCQ